MRSGSRAVGVSSAHRTASRHSKDRIRGVAGAFLPPGATTSGPWSRAAPITSPFIGARLWAVLRTQSRSDEFAPHASSYSDDVLLGFHARLQRLDQTFDGVFFRFDSGVESQCRDGPARL